MLFIFVVFSALLSIYFAWMWYKLNRFMLCAIVSVFSVAFYVVLLFFDTGIAIALTLFYSVILLLNILKLSKMIVKAHEYD